MEQFAHDALTLVRENSAWAVPITFLLAFCESIAFLSLLVPATVLLVGLGAIVGTGTIDFVSVWVAAALGAVLGDLVSYAAGALLKGRVAGVWPLSRHPDMLIKGEVFFRRFGIPGLFVGRFLGPMRASVPLAAGMCRMNVVTFTVVGIASAFAWAGVLIAPGAFGVAAIL
jgi:membrane protein DedA with SNARE-associated domain